MQRLEEWQEVASLRPFVTERIENSRIVEGVYHYYCNGCGLEMCNGGVGHKWKEHLQKCQPFEWDVYMRSRSHSDIDSEPSKG